MESAAVATESIRPSSYGTRSGFPSATSGDEIITHHAHIDEEQIIEFCPNGRYGKLNMILGKGAYKIVWKALDLEEGLEVAWNSFQTTKQESAELSQEIEILKKVRHPNIISFRDSWYNNGEFVFITELMTSGTLREYVRKLKRPNIKVVKWWARQILKGLLYLHSYHPPIIHRDIKCDNIFINGAHGEIKIGDMGTAKMKLGKKYTVIGTPEFMAPEMYEEKGYSEKVDVYAFGMCLLEMVTGEYPYSECKNAAQIYKKVSAGVKPECLQRVEEEQVLSVINGCIAMEHERFSVRQILGHPFFVSEPELLLLSVDETRYVLGLQVIFRGLDKFSVKFEYNVDNDTPEEVVNEMIIEKVVPERYQMLITSEIHRILREFHQKYPLALETVLQQKQATGAKSSEDTLRMSTLMASHGDLVGTGASASASIPIPSAQARRCHTEDDSLFVDNTSSDRTVVPTSPPTIYYHHQRERSQEASPLRGGNAEANVSPSSGVSSSPSNLSWKRDIQYKAELVRAQKEVIQANERALEAEKRAREMETKAHDEEQRNMETDSLIERLRLELLELSALKSQQAAMRSLVRSTEASMTSSLTPGQISSHHLKNMECDQGTHHVSSHPTAHGGFASAHPPAVNHVHQDGASLLSAPDPSHASYPQPLFLDRDDHASPDHQLHHPRQSSATSTNGISEPSAPMSLPSSNHPTDSLEFNEVITMLPFREIYPEMPIEDLVLEVAQWNHRGPEKASEWIAKLRAQDIMTVGNLKELHEEDWNRLSLTVFASRALKNAVQSKSLKFVAGTAAPAARTTSALAGTQPPISGSGTSLSSPANTASLTAIKSGSSPPSATIVPPSSGSVNPGHPNVPNVSSGCAATRAPSSSSSMMTTHLMGPSSSSQPALVQLQPQDSNLSPNDSTPLSPISPASRTLLSPSAAASGMPSAPGSSPPFSVGHGREAARSTSAPDSSHPVASSAPHPVPAASPTPCPAAQAIVKSRPL